MHCIPMQTFAPNYFANMIRSMFLQETISINILTTTNNSWPITHSTDLLQFTY